ncbi:MAG: hypothetical protein RLZZ142_2907 [Verrucomicrobiota bacterium]
MGASKEGGRSGEGFACGADEREEKGDGRRVQRRVGDIVT